MLDPKDAKRRICEMLDMGDEELLAELDRYLLLSDEHHQRISCVLDEMMQEVDGLISRIDDIEGQPLEIEDEESISR